MQEALDRIYQQDEYFENYYATAQGIKGYIDSIAVNGGYDEEMLALIKRFKNKGNLLDIGCAGGRFLANARKQGFNVCGIEPNPRMAAYAHDVLGLDVHCRNLEEGCGAANYFDIIHAADVLEHILEIKKAMAIIRRLLHNDGILVIKQPLMYNISLFNFFLKGNMLFKRDRYSLNPPAHLWEFDASSFRRFLRQEGLEIVYYKVFEGRAKPAAVYGAPTVKNKAACGLKHLSSFVSNYLLKGLGWGDRAIAVCKKAGNANSE